MGGVVGHGTVDVVGDGARAFGGVGQIAADGYLVASLRGGVYEGEICAVEEGCYQRRIVEERALEEGNVGQAGELLRDDAFEGVDLGTHAIADGRGNADQGGGLAARGIDYGDCFGLGHMD